MGASFASRKSGAFLVFETSTSQRRLPTLLFIFEMLVWAFESRRQVEKRPVNELSPIRRGDDSLSMGWDNENEIKNWKRCLEWWVGKCVFCAGKGLCGYLVQRSLGACHRGGAQ